MLLDDLSRIDLGVWPTPIRRAPKTSEELGVDVWIKFEEECGAWGGNKVRKLEFILAEAHRRRVRTLLAYGVGTSNWTSALAYHAAREGFGIELFLWGEPPGHYRRLYDSIGALVRPVGPVRVTLGTIGSLAVPARSQMEEDERIRHRVCSPTSVAMVLEYLGMRVETRALGSAELVDGIRSLQAVTGAIIDPLGAYLLLRGLKKEDVERGQVLAARAPGEPGSRGAAVECVSAIDIALWDIRGKVLSQPIYELLGGAVRDGVALYTHRDQAKFNSREGVSRAIKDIVESGHTAIKFDPFPHQGRNASGPAREQRDGYLDGSMTRKDERKAAELTALIRETAGPDVEILIDAHGRFDVPTAIRLCWSLEEAGQIDWFEEPCPPESLNALKQAVAFSVNVAAAVFFLFSGQVVWSAALVMAIGALIGGMLGGRLAGRIKPSTLRWTVVVIGVMISIIYFVRG